MPFPIIFGGACLQGPQKVGPFGLTAIYFIEATAYLKSYIKPGLLL